MSSPTPRVARWLLTLFLSADERMDVLGDLEEGYVRRVADYGATRASIAYWGEVIVSLPVFISRSILWTLIMWKSYFRTAVRGFLRHKAYSAINVFGLAIGLACAFFILLWAHDELSFDGYHEEGDQLYRVMANTEFGEDIFTRTHVPKPLDDVLDEEYPEITHSILFGGQRDLVLARGDVSFRETARHVGQDFFSVFSHPLIVGDPAAALEVFDSVVLSETLARKYFGDDWLTTGVLGEMLRLDDRLDLTVTGVFEDVPANSSFQFDFVLPAEEHVRRNQWLNEWENSGMALFVRLQEGADPEVISRKIENVVRDHEETSNERLFLQPYTDIYLRSDFEDGVLVGGRIEYVRVFSLVGLFIILIASINFMNLATARSGQRAREIGVRKAVGATRPRLAGQFLAESVLTALAALVLAVGIVALLLPAFNDLAQKRVVLDFLNARMWFAFGGLALVTGFLAGSYPALYLSAFNVVGVLRNNTVTGTTGSTFRNGLVAFQFVMSVALIVATVTVSKQIGYIQSKDLGVDREHLLFVELQAEAQAQGDVFKEQLLREPGILQAALSSENPLNAGTATRGARWDGKDPNSQTRFYVISADHDFITTAGMTLKEGRLFSGEFGADSSAFIVNEAAAVAMGMEEPLGQGFRVWGRSGQIVGVVKDFHLKDMYTPIEPVVFRLSPSFANKLFVRVSGDQIPEAIASIERIYERFSPGYPFSYHFLDDEFDKMYRSEVVIGSLADSFALLAILIACLGLYGLALFSAERRTHEIGVRKVLGASVGGMVLLLTRDFVKIVVAASVVACLVAWAVMNEWLAGFAYHVDQSLWTFILATALALLIALATVSHQAFKAARADPVRSLRSE